MANKGKGSSGLLLGGLALAAAFAVFRQGQAAASTLGSARLERFELKGLSGTSLNAIAHVQFSNTEVSRDTALQALGMNVLYNDTVISTVHLLEPQTLPANQNTTVPVPMTLNLGSLFTQLALTGKVPSLASFKSVTSLMGWLRDKIAPESLQMQGTAKVDGLPVRFNQPLPLENYLPSNPRPGPVDQLNTGTTTKAVVRTTGAPAILPPPKLTPRPSTTTASVKVPARVKAGQVVKKGGAVLTKAAGIVRQAAGAVKSIKQARPAAGAKPTAGKVRQAVKPPAEAEIQELIAKGYTRAAALYVLQNYPKPATPAYDPWKDPWNYPDGKVPANAW